MTSGQILTILFSGVVVTLLIYMIKGWFDGVKEELKKISTMVTTLFNRGEEDRLAIKDCQLKAKETYATIKDLKALEERVSDLERGN